MSLRAVLLAACALLLMAGCGGGSPGGSVPPGGSWSVDTSSAIWAIGYGSGNSFPQYAALDTTSGYLRLVPTTQSGFGTSTIIVPSFWTGGVYYQGAPIAASHSVSGNNLVIDLKGTLGGLSFQGELTLLPPNQHITAQVNMMSVTGNVVLDNRPGEAFKPMMLSSMHISSTQWDAQSAYVGNQTLALPASGWIVQPPGSSNVFGLTGGTSSWKTNAPTMEVTFPSAQNVTGYVTSSSDPNDDNVGFWATSDTVVTSYSYSVTAKP
jgi:hypothetical protein